MGVGEIRAGMDTAHGGGEQGAGDLVFGGFLDGVLGQAYVSRWERRKVSALGVVDDRASESFAGGWFLANG